MIGCAIAFQIVMEYCGAGSVLDIMKLRGMHHSLPRGLVKTLTESEIATILSDTLKGEPLPHVNRCVYFWQLLE